MSDTESKIKKLHNKLKLKKHSKMLKRHARRAEGATIRHAHRFLISRWDNIREVRYHIIGWMAGVGVLICIVGLQMIWYQQSYITTAPVKGGTYAEALKGPLDTLNPLYATSPVELAAAQLLYSSLYEYDETGHIHGDLATSLTRKNEKVYTINIRHDARWHDGEPLTARDVVFTVDLIKNTSARSVLAASWQSVTAKYIDDYTVEFTLPAAYAAFPQALTFAILPFHLLNSVEPSELRENKFSNQPVGSGPFSLRLLQTVSVADERKIVYLNANKDYYAGAPRLNNLQLHAFADDEAMREALKTEEVTGASDVSADTVRSLNLGRYEVVTLPVNSGVYAMFNLSNPLLKDDSVRKALLLGTDTENIRRQILGSPRPLYMPFVEGMVPGTEKITPPKTNRQAAMELLEKEGWKLTGGEVRSKGDQNLQLRVVTRKNSDFEAVLMELASQWRSMGIQVDAEVFDTSDPSRSFAGEILQQQNYDVLVDELVIGGDPDVFAFWNSNALQNFTNYNNANSDDLLSSARTTSDPRLRSVKYLAFARQWMSDIPAIGLYQSNYFYVHSKGSESVNEYLKVVSGNDHYANVRYWTAEKDRVFKTP